MPRSTLSSPLDPTIDQVIQALAPHRNLTRGQAAQRLLHLGAKAAIAHSNAKSGGGTDGN